MEKNRILIAGVGGASLGTEIIKCLKKAGCYEIFVCDICKYAYGLYNKDLKSFVINEDNYIDDVINICVQNNIRYVIPGAEKTMVILGRYITRFKQNNIKLVSNSSEIIGTFSNKCTTFNVLEQLGFRIPYSKAILETEDLKEMKYPCILKPSEGSGGSTFVFYAKDYENAIIYAKYLLDNKQAIIAQEYISEEEGEFTVGVLSLPNKEIVGSIALKRMFPNKLSILSKTEETLISTGYSQGLIEDYPNVRKTCEKIAKSINSKGPINIQGRMLNGEFIPFEINPRFSASTYLRAMAGFNEVDIFLKYLITGKVNKPNNIEYGYYLRSLDEIYIKEEEII